MSETIKEKLTKNIGKVVTVFLLNNFKFQGILKNVDSDFLEILDEKSSQLKLIAVKSISEISLK